MMRSAKRTFISTLALWAQFPFALGAHAQMPDELSISAREALPGDPSDTELAAVLDDGVRTDNGVALATLVPRSEGSLIVVFIRQADGTYLTVDASVIESAIFGYFGRPRTDYERYESEILDLQQRDDGLIQLQVRTRAWRMGQRYTGGDMILIRLDGLVMQR
jgi:hypothetical protein